MAWYNGTYACGHEGRTNITGPTRNRQWIAERHFEKLCSECWEQEKERQRQEANAKAAEAAKEMELPELTGTEKQVAWAVTIRNKIIEISHKYDEDEVKLVIDWMLNNRTSASYWIDNRGACGTEFMFERLLKDEHKVMGEEIEVNEEVVDQIRAESLVYPEESKTKVITEIRVEGHYVVAVHEERNEAFRKVVKSLRYKWENGRWQKALNDWSGPAKHLMAELGNQLLAAGFPVRIEHSEARKMAAEGTYEPECTRWVKQLLNGDYENWFSISWERCEDFYEVARRIPKSKWCNGKVIAPPESFEDVVGFAETYGFKLSSGAEGVIKAAEEAFDKVLKVSPKGKVSRQPEPMDKPGKLDAPREVGVDEELLDKD